MASRYDDDAVFTNSEEIYFHILEERGLKGIVQFETKIFSKPTKSDIDRLVMTQIIWSTGDRLFKLAAEYYGNPEYWWIIARFNAKPTEAHYELGDVVYIPGPPDVILDLYRR